jgi:hypothetical protein
MMVSCDCGCDCCSYEEYTSSPPTKEDIIRETKTREFLELRFRILNHGIDNTTQAEANKYIELVGIAITNASVQIPTDEFIAITRMAKCDTHSK